MEDYAMTLFKKNGKSNSNSGTAARKDSALLNLRRIFIGVLFGSVVFVLLTLIFSLVMTLGAIPDSAALVFAFLSIALASFAAGFAALWNIGNGGLINGHICGGIFAALHSLLALVFGEGGRLVYVLIAVVIELILSTFGGIVSVNVRSE